MSNLLKVGVPSRGAGTAPEATWLTTPPFSQFWQQRVNEGIESKIWILFWRLMSQGCSLEGGSWLYWGVGSQSHVYRAQGTFRERNQEKTGKLVGTWSQEIALSLVANEDPRELNKEVLTQLVKYLLGTSSRKALLQVGTWQCKSHIHLNGD